MKIIFRTKYNSPENYQTELVRLRELVMLRGFYQTKKIFYALIYAQCTGVYYRQDSLDFIIDFTYGREGNRKGGTVELEYLVDEFDDIGGLISAYNKIFTGDLNKVLTERVAFLHVLMQSKLCEENSFSYFVDEAEGKFRARKLPKSVNFSEKTDRMIFLEFGSGELELCDSVVELYDKIDEVYNGGTSGKIIFSQEQIWEETARYVSELYNDLGLMPFRMLGVVEELMEKYGADNKQKIFRTLADVVSRLDKTYKKKRTNNELRTVGRLRMDAYILTLLGEGGQAEGILREGTLLGKHLWEKTEGNYKEGFIIEKKNFFDAKQTLKGTGRIMPNIPQAMQGLGNSVRAVTQSTQMASNAIKELQRREEEEMQRRVLGALTERHSGRPFDTKAKREIEEYLLRAGLGGELEIGINEDDGSLKIIRKKE